MLLQRESNLLKKNNKHSQWRLRLELKVNSLRSKLDRLTQCKRAIIRSKINKKVIEPMNIDNMEINITIEIIETFSQKLSAYAKRLRRYKECTDRKQPNSELLEKEKYLYKNLSGRKFYYKEEIPTVEKITDF